MTAFKKIFSQKIVCDGCQQNKSLNLAMRSDGTPEYMLCNECLQNEDNFELPFNTSEERELNIKHGKN